jgi:hypothetical protein
MNDKTAASIPIAMDDLNEQISFRSNYVFKIAQKQSDVGVQRRNNGKGTCGYISCLEGLKVLGKCPKEMTLDEFALDFFSKVDTRITNSHQLSHGLERNVFISSQLYMSSMFLFIRMLKCDNHVNVNQVDGLMIRAPATFMPFSEAWSRRKPSIRFCIPQQMHCASITDSTIMSG